MLGILQELKIQHQGTQELVLIEQPRLEWGLAFGAFITGIVLVIAGTPITSGVAFALVAFLAATAQTRIITFDAVDQNNMRVVQRSFFSSHEVNTLSLANIQRVELREEDSGHSQIILHTTQGETGLSVYSRDMRVWKPHIVAAIQRLLDEAKT